MQAMCVALHFNNRPLVNSLSRSFSPSPGVNYYLSVIPFLAAVQKGLIGDGLIQVQVQAPAEAAEDSCTSYTDCSAKYPDLMAKWEEFFQVSYSMNLLPHGKHFPSCPRR